MSHPYALDTRIAPQQCCRRGVVQHGNAKALQSVVQCRNQMLAAAQNMAREPTPELEFSLDLERLPSKRRLKPHALFAQP